MEYLGFVVFVLVMMARAWNETQKKQVGGRRPPPPPQRGGTPGRPPWVPSESRDFPPMGLPWPEETLPTPPEGGMAQASIPAPARPGGGRLVSAGGEGAVSGEGQPLGEGLVLREGQAFPKGKPAAGKTVQEKARDRRPEDNVRPVPPSPWSGTVLLRGSRKEILQGIIWSQILQPPRSRRPARQYPRPF